MNDLIKELEAATEGGSAELDLKVMKELGLIPQEAKIVTPSNSESAYYRAMLESGNPIWFIESDDPHMVYEWDVEDKESATFGHISLYTESLDVTENALPEGWCFQAMVLGDSNTWHVTLGSPGIEPGTINHRPDLYTIRDDNLVTYKSLPIARTIAMLRAWEEVER